MPLSAVAVIISRTMSKITAKASPLEKVLQDNGAEFREEDGWRLPLHFGAPLDEYQAVRSRVGLFDHCDRSLLRFTGEDRVPFLQGMVSNDVTKLRPGQGMLATFADIQGKILADTRIFCTEDSFVVELFQPLSDKIQAHLQKYLIADEVEIADLTDDHGILSLQGPKSIQLLEALSESKVLPDQELSHVEFQIDIHKCRLVRATHTGESGFDLWISPKELPVLAALIQEKGKAYSAQWIGTEAQEILRIEAGIPRYGVDMDQENLVLETNLQDAVNFEKGCYLGQEVIERIHSRGHVNKKLVGLVLEGENPAQRGDPIQAETKEVGKVTSSVNSPLLNRPVALGYVHKDYINPGTSLTIQTKAKSLTATVSPLPFGR